MDIKYNEMNEKIRHLINLKLVELMQEFFKLFRSDLKEAYDLAVKILKKYVDMDEKYYHLIAMWILGTYFHKAFVTYPYLFINAMKGSGKTRTLKLIAKLSWNGHVLVDLSEAVLFRTAIYNTFCIDELEDIKRKERNVLRLLLNSAYKKEIGVRRLFKLKTKTKEKHLIEEFPLFAPIAMANITGMENVLGDRCIEIILLRSNNKRITKLLELFDRDPDIIKFKEIMSNYADLNEFIIKNEDSLRDFVKLFNFQGTDEEFIKLKDALKEKGLDITELLMINRTLSGEEGVEGVEGASKKIYIIYILYALVDYLLLEYNNYLFNNTLNTPNTLTTLNTPSTPNTPLYTTLHSTPFFNIKEFYNAIINLDIESRDLELSFPLLIMSYLIGNFNEFKEIIQNIMQKRKEEEYVQQKQISFLEFLYNLENKSNDFIYIKDLKEKFKEETEIDVTNYWVGITLKHYGFILDKRRLKKGVQVIIDWKRVEEEYNKVKPFIVKDDEQQTEQPQQQKKQDINNQQQTQTQPPEAPQNAIGSPTIKIFRALKPISIMITKKGSEMPFTANEGEKFSNFELGDNWEDVIKILLEEGYAELVPEVK